MSTTLFPLQYLRQNADPIDVDSVFNTTAERLAYLSNGRRYPGQIVADLEDGSVYVLDPSGSAWVELGGNAAGLNGQVQYNNAGEFGADAEFTYNAITSTVGLRNIANATTSVNVLVGTTTADAWATTYTDTVPPPVPFDLACGLTQTIAANPSDGYTLSNLGPPDPLYTKYTIDNGYIIYTVNGYGSGALGDGGAGSSGYGLRFDPTGQSNYGPDDYIQPGDPWEGFGLQVNGVTIATGSNSTRPTTESWNTWNAGDNLIVAKPDLDPATQGVFVVQYQTVGNEPVIRIKMSYTNSTTAPVSVKMIRGIDPDIDNFQYNEFDTLNWRGLGTISGNDITYAVGTYSEKPLAIYAPGNGYTHNTGIVSGWPTYSFDYVLGGPEDGGNGSYFDYAICAAWDCGVVEPGETATVCVYYICSQTESEISGYITGSAPVQYTPDFDTGAVAIDSSGASYCAGVDSYTGNIFITKFNSTGTLVWQKSLAGIGGKYCNTIKIDSAGNIYVAVNYDTIPGTIVLKINTSLTIEWQTDILDGTNRIAIQNMQLDNSGNLWILASDPDNEAYAHLLKLDNTGTMLWQKVISDAGFNVVAQDLVLTPTGATVLINSFSVGVYKPTLLNYSSTGTLIDQITVVDPLAILFTNRNNLAVDSTGATYILQRWATTQNYAILTKIVLGAIEWQKKVVIPNGSDLRSSGVHIDQSDNVYISLARDDFADNISALYILKFSSVGTLIWSNGFTATNGVYYNFEGYKNNIAVGSNYFTVVGYIGAAGGGYLSLAVHMPLDGNGWGSNDGFSYGPIDALISTPSVFTVSTGTMSDSTASLTGGTIVLTIDTLANSRNLVVFSGKSDWNFNPDGSTSLPNYTLPANDGLDGQILTTDGSGILTWVPKEIDPATPVGRGSIFGYTTANSNVHIGYCSGNIAQTGNDNIAIGYQSLQCNTYGNGNTAIGCRAMQQNMYGTCNTAVGNFSLKCNCNGSYNVAVGDCALLKNLAGNYNTALGKGSLQGIIGTGYNVGVGFEAGRCVTTGGNNTIIGSLSGCGGLSNTVLIGSGTCERIKVDGTGLYINGLPFTGGGGDPATPATLGTVKGYTTGLGNTSIGCCAGNTTQTGCGNIAIGCCALPLNTVGCHNFSVGFATLTSNTAGSNNFAQGYQALAGNTIGTSNLALGWKALNANTAGSHSIALGECALASNHSVGNQNIGLGYASLYSNTTGCFNIAIGILAATGNTSGSRNIAIGQCALSYNGGNVDNIAIGANAGRGPSPGITGGTFNIAMGSCTLQNIAAGSFNIGLGYRALYGGSGGGGCACALNSIAIGAYALESAYQCAPNIAIGCSALRYINGGSLNIAIGSNAGICNNSGVSNIFIGNNSGCCITTGCNNTIIGSLCGSATLQCTVLIGAGTCERVKVDNSGLYVNGSLFSVAVATPTSLGTIFGYTTGSGNVSIGCCAGNTTQTGSNNIAVGCLALSCSTTGIHNIALGFSALKCNQNGSHNVAIGRETLYGNRIGTHNIGIGYGSLRCNTSGNSNTAIGNNALKCNTYGASNLAIGSQALNVNTSGSHNIAIGEVTLFCNTFGRFNVAFGCQALYRNTEGCNNFAFGYGALCCNSTGNNNFAIGQRAMASNKTGTDNFAVGCQSLLLNISGQNNFAQGRNSLANNQTGNNNFGSGFEVLCNINCGSNNIAIGCQALTTNTIGCGNIGLGSQTLRSATTTCFNIGLGDCAGCLITTGSNNTVIGNLPGAGGCVCTLLIGAGVCERIRVDNTGMYVNGSLLSTSIAATPTVLGTVFGYTSSGNTFIGCCMGNSTSVGSNNFGLGLCSMQNIGNAQGNIGIGHSVLRNLTTGLTNIGIGGGTLFCLTTGCNNIAIGCGALYNNIYGISDNVAIGYQAQGNARGGCNVVIGACALKGRAPAYGQSYGCANVALGTYAMFCTITASCNVAIGCGSLYNNTAGCGNVAVGHASLCANTVGVCNISIGLGSMISNTTGASNISIGSCAGCSITTGAGNTIIGSLPGSAGLTCTLILGSGSCERLRIDNTCICVNGSTLYTLLTGNGLSNTSVGFRIVPQNTQCADYTIVAADSAGHVLHPAVDTNPRTYTIPSNAAVAFPIGTSITIVNESFYPVTIAINSDTLYLAGSTTVGSRTLGQNGVATILKIQSTVWLISGSGLT